MTVIIAGSRVNNITTRKYDFNGNEITTGNWPVDCNHPVQDVAIDPDENVYTVSGLTSGSGGLRKYSSDGTNIWTDLFVGPPRGVAVDPDGNVYVSRGEHSMDDGSIAAYQPNGDPLWHYETTSSRKIDVNSNKYVGASRARDLPEVATDILKFHPNGNLMWHTGGADHTSPPNNAVRIDKDGHIYSGGDSHPGELIKWNSSNGNKLWSTEFGSGVSSCTLDFDNIHIYFTGGTTLKKFTINGSEITTGNWPASDFSNLNSSATDLDSNIYVGTSPSIGMPRTVKYSSDGTLLWNFQTEQSRHVAVYPGRAGAFAEEPPVADVGGPYPDTAHSRPGYPNSINLDGSGSENADTYQWYIGSVHVNNLIATGVSPTITYSQVVAISPGNGTKTLILRASSGGDSDTDSTTITLVNTLPTASANAPNPSAIVHGQNTSLTGTISDVDGQVDRYQWYVDGNLLVDETITPTESTSVNDSVSYTTIRNAIGGGFAHGVSYTLALRCRDNDDDWSTFSNTSITLNNTKPTASANVPSPSTIVHGQNTSLTGTISDVDGQVNRYQWYVDGTAGGNLLVDETITSTPSTNVNDSVSYDGIKNITGDNGSFTLYLRCRDNDDEWSDFSTTSITLNNTPPVITEVSSTESELKHGESTTLSGTATDVDGTVVSYEWFVNTTDPGNLLDTGSSVSVSYTDIKTITGDNGTFTLILKVTDNDGGTDEDDSLSITLNNTPPVITEVSSTESELKHGESTTLSGTATDVDGTVVSYEWFVNTTDPGNLLDTGSSVSVSYTDIKTITGDNGTFTLILKVTDNDGGTDEDDSLSITLNNTPPTADAGGPYSIPYSGSINLDGSGQDVDGTIEEYRWRLEGTILAGVTSPTSPLTYAECLAIVGEKGTYDLSLEVRDNDNAWSDPDITPLTLENAKPVADAGGPYGDVYRTDDIILDGSGSYDPDGTIELYKWYVGSVDHPTDDNLIASSTEATVEADFDVIRAKSGGTFGEKTIYLLVQDDDDEWSDPSPPTTITLLNIFPVADPGGPYDLYTGETINLDGSGSYDDDGHIISYKWYLFDDTTEDNLIVETSSAITPITHTQILNMVDLGDCEDGSYDLVLKVQDNDEDWSYPEATTLNLLMPRLPYGLKWYKCLQIPIEPKGRAGVDLTKNFQLAADNIQRGLLLRSFPNWQENQNNWDTVHKAVYDRFGIYKSQTNNSIDLFGNFEGNEKWMGAVSAPNGKIYCVPRTSSNILVIDPSDNDSTDTFGDISNSFVGGVLAPNGKIYCAPVIAGDYVLKIDPETHTTDEINDLNYVGYDGGVVANNGEIFFIPSSSERLLILDPTDDSFVEIADPLITDDPGKWSGGILAPDGSIYCIPATSDKVLRIDPETQTMELLSEEYPEAGTKWWGGVIAANGMIYGIPYQSTHILKINPYNKTSSLIGPDLGSENKWLGGVMAPNGFIYGIPAGAETILVINPGNDSVTEIGNFSDDALKWTGGVVGSNGAIYGTPRNSEQVLKIGTGFTDVEMDFVLSRYWNKL